jgi:transposase
MRQKSGTEKRPAEAVIKDVRRATRKQYGAEEKIRIVLEGLRGEESIAALCRREGIAESLYYNWSKEFLEAGKKRLAGDTARAATSDEVKQLRRETRDLKEVVAEQALELRLLNKSMVADGGDDEGDILPPRSWKSSGSSSHRICRRAARGRSSAFPAPPAIAGRIVS